MQDTRNVGDEFKGMAHEDILKHLDERGVRLEIAIENTLRDFNMGTIVRTANAFGVRTVHVIGRKQWNKRGAMMTDIYLTVVHHSSPAAFVEKMNHAGKTIYAIENNTTSSSIFHTTFEREAVFIFGQEGAGVSAELLTASHHIVHIDQQGSTRSMNVGVAAGIAMYEWSRQHR